MSSLGSPNPFLFGGKKTYETERSLRFNRNDNAYLTRTPSSAGNRKTFTFSAWVKLGQTGINTSNDPGNGLFLSCGAGSGGANMTYRITNNGYVGVDYYGIGGYYSTGRLRDPSAWYHIVWVMDTTESTAANRFKVYVNNVLFYNNQLGLSQNADTPLNNNSATTIGAYSYSTSHAYRLDGYLAEVNFIDGQAYDPSYFGETDATTGQWNPKEYTGSYGTNGFYLNFSDNSGTTATTLGKDSSGNGNNFTPNNFAVSDSMLDTPTNNFATMNPLNGYTGLSQGNLRFNTYNDSSGPRSVQATIALPKSGKWYWEARYQESGTGTVSTKYFGLSQIQNTNGYLTAPYVYYGRTNIKNGTSSEDITNAQDWYNGTGVPAIVAIAVDVDNNSVEYFHNGSSQGTITLPTLTSLQEYFFTWANTSGGSSSSLNWILLILVLTDTISSGQVSSGIKTDARLSIGVFGYVPSNDLGNLS